MILVAASAEIELLGSRHSSDLNSLCLTLKVVKYKPIDGQKIKKKNCNLTRVDPADPLHAETPSGGGESSFSLEEIPNRIVLSTVRSIIIFYTKILNTCQLNY